MIVHVVDLGGNTRSVITALSRLGVRAEVTNTGADIETAERIILPGQVTFATAMRVLDPLRGAIASALTGGAALLGICAGMQALFEDSEESPGILGLGFLAGRVTKLPVPHFGWSEVHFRAFVAGMEYIARPMRHFYFAHGYAKRYEGADHDGIETVATINYDTGTSPNMVAAVQRKRISGVQFHPEKSQAEGLKLLDRWVRDGVIVNE